MKFTIGVDLGGTNMVLGLVDHSFKVADMMKEPTEAHQGSEGVLQRMAAGIERLISRNGLTHADIEAVGAGIPGFVDPERGVCLGAANLKWRDVAVAERLTQLLELPVYIDNDVRMYVLGEALYGAGRGHRVVLGITLGTGIAAALVCDGRPFYGAANIAGELGHIPMDGEQAVCGCGMVGCLETVASATGLARQAAQMLAEGRSSVLREIAGDAKTITAAHISQAYDMGDQAAIEIMRHTGRTLGKALSYALVLYNPDVIVVGGGVANAGERILGAAREEMSRRVLGSYMDGLMLKTDELGDAAGVLGSASYALKKWQSNG